jgi:hypothetical protein
VSTLSSTGDPGLTLLSLDTRAVRSGLAAAALAQDADPVAQRHRLNLVVGHVDPRPVRYANGDVTFS